MSTRLFLILSFVFSLLQGTFLPLVIAEGPLVVFYLITRTGKNVFPLLLSGIIFDLLQKQHLGVTSLIFLGFLGLVMVLKERMQFSSSLLLAGFALVINILRAKIVFGYIELYSLFAMFAVSYLLFKIVWRPEVLGRIRL